MALVWFASFLPLPDTLTNMLSESRAVGRITEPDNLPRQLLDSLTQDRWEEMLIKVGEITGRVNDLLRDLLGENAPPP